jgi:hypothetical protein
MQDSQGGNAPSELNSYLGYVNSSVYPATGVFVYPYPCVPLVDAFYDDDLSDPGLLGLYECQVYADPGIWTTCIEADVKINKYSIALTAQQTPGVSASALRKSTWCHETGHSYGLNHLNSDCMTLNVNTSSTYGGHNINHLLLNLL